MTTEIITATDREAILAQHIEKIKAANSGFLDAACKMGNAILAGANFRREAGIYLESLKTATDSEGRKVVPHGEWEGLFASAKGKSRSDSTFDFDYSTARNYIIWAKKHPDPITDVSQIVRDGKAMLIDAGEIEAGTREPGSQNEQPDSQKWLVGVLKAWEYIGAAIDRKPVRDWPEPQRITLKEKLRPLAELYSTL